LVRDEPKGYRGLPKEQVPRSGPEKKGWEELKNPKEVGKRESCGGERSGLTGKRKNKASLWGKAVPVDFFGGKPGQRVDLGN